MADPSKSKLYSAAALDGSSILVTIRMEDESEASIYVPVEQLVDIVTGFYVETLKMAKGDDETSITKRNFKVQPIPATQLLVTRRNTHAYSVLGLAFGEASLNVRLSESQRSQILSEFSLPNIPGTKH